MSLFTFYDELKARLSLSSPEFMLKFRAIYIKITAIAAGVAILSAPELDILKNIFPQAFLDWAFKISTVITLMASKGWLFDTKTAVADPAKLEEKKIEVIEKKLENQSDATGVN
jgi:hypothetical protein